MIKISKYSTLRKIIQKFSEGHFDLVIIISRGGLGKTFLAEEILDDKVCEINSHVTPLGLYQLGYEFKDQLMWFDDIEALFNDDKLVGLMKQFCQTQTLKKIRWMTSKGISTEDLKIPREFKTKSKILLTCNSLRRIRNDSVLALLDRAIQIYFIPSDEEIINYIKSNFKSIDESIITKLTIQKKLSLRDYVKSVQLKGAGFNFV